MTPPELDDDHVVAICGVLADHGVSYVVIGGIAARLHDTGHATVDIDVCPSRAKDNLARLATALRALGARLRVEGDAEGVAFEAHADLLAKVTTMTLITDEGPLDLCFAPAGFARGYDELAPRAITLHLATIDVPVASLEDVVESKRAAGRPKDIAALPGTRGAPPTAGTTTLTSRPPAPRMQAPHVPEWDGLDAVERSSWWCPAPDAARPGGRHRRCRTRAGRPDEERTPLG